MTDAIVSRFLKNEDETLAAGAALAPYLRPGLVIYLHGGLGAGKTTFSRGLIKALGHVGHVKSPTYTLVEPYEFTAFVLYHFDLYRMTDPEELEFIGGRDYFSGEAVSVVEWPEQGRGTLPPADLDVTLMASDGGRTLTIQAGTPAGRQSLNAWQQFL